MIRRVPEDDEGRIDLSAIDPDLDRAAEERFVSGVMARVAGRPTPAAAPLDPLIGISSMLPVPAIAAGIVLAIALGAMGLGLNRKPLPPQTVEQAIGVPPEFLAQASITPPVDKP
jgi:hypothetical protein